MATAEPVTDQNVVTFVYRVGKDDETETGEYLDYSSTGALSLKENAEITSGENPVSLYLPEPGRGQSLSECKIVIDNTAPVNSTTPSVLKNGSAVSAFGGAKYFKENDKMTVKVPLNETVTVKEGAAPYIEMNYQKPGSQENARWVYEHKEDSSGKTTLFFDYTVSAEDTLEKGTLNTSGDAWKIHMEPGDIADAAGNDLDPALKAPSWSNPFSNTSVSYTHLDVYKRQLQYRVIKCLISILRKDMAQDVILTAHSGVLRAISNNLEGKDISEDWKKMKNGEVRVIVC